MCRAPGMFRSSVKRASPVSSAGSSRRRIRVPITGVVAGGLGDGHAGTPLREQDSTAATMFW